jgi:hypothetical protein
MGDDGHDPARGNARRRSPQVHTELRSIREHGAKSAAVRDRAILALLSERTLTAAAAKAGIDESTLRRWLARDGEFQAAYPAARRYSLGA